MLYRLEEFLKFPFEVKAFLKFKDNNLVLEILPKTKLVRNCSKEK